MNTLKQYLKLLIMYYCLLVLETLKTCFLGQEENTL